MRITIMATRASMVPSSALRMMNSSTMRAMEMRTGMMFFMVRVIRLLRVR